MIYIAGLNLEKCEVDMIEIPDDAVSVKKDESLEEAISRFLQKKGYAVDSFIWMSSDTEIPVQRHFVKRKSSFIFPVILTPNKNEN